MLTRISRGIYKRTHPWWSFDESAALEINKARMAHLASLHLPIEAKSVLEVGSGIGLLTDFFEARGCKVFSTDARPENIAELLRRHPRRRAAVLDLEQTEAIGSLGRFDVVFCYGTLYHLASPEPALKALAQISDLILLETCLSPGREEAVPLVEESAAPNQAYSQMGGTRPTRAWVLSNLTRYWGNGYISVTQPSHPEFPLDWTAPPAGRNTRAIFVGSKAPLANPLLTSDIPDRHRTSA
jgi:SAM-dependent methyltransferase